MTKMANPFEPECGPRCKSRQHALDLNSVVTKGNLQELQAYSRLCYNAGHYSDVFGRSVLHLAAACGKTEIVEWLLNDKNSDLTLKDLESGWTALHRAIFYGQLTSARLLIQYGSDLYTRDHEALSPLDLVMRDKPGYIVFDRSDPCEVFSWGDNSNFTLGHANEHRCQGPEQIDFFKKQNITLKEVVMCKYHTVFLSQNGQVYTCGHGHGGRLGHHDEHTCLVPKLVQGIANEVCIQIAASRDHTVLLMEGGIVYSFGLNDYYQLGHSTTKCLEPKQVNTKNMKGKSILGVCAGRFHTVIYTADSVYTFGLNAGQLGHPKGGIEKHPRQVSFLNHKNIVIQYVTCSDAATVCLTTAGDVYVLHEYQCRKIASKFLDITKVTVHGGNLDHTDSDVLREKGGFELTIVLLNASGKVFVWRGTSPSMKRCKWMIKRQLFIQDVSLSSSNIAVITEDGEGFIGTFANKRQASGKEATSNKDQLFSSHSDDFGMIRLMDLLLKDPTEDILVHRIPNIHRGTKIFTDPKGRNFATLQGFPNAWLTDVPSVQSSEMITDFQTLLEEADEYDLIHDVIVQADDHVWPAHKFVLLSRSDHFNKLLAEVNKKETVHDTPVISIPDMHPDILEQLLTYIYTDTCDLLTVGAKFELSQWKHNPNHGDGFDSHTLPTSPHKVSAFEVHQKKKKHNKKDNRDENYNIEHQNPIKLLQEAARKFGVKGLSKRLDAVKYVKGEIQANKHLPSPRIKFDRKRWTELYDVQIQSDDEKVIHCHKCVIVARLEYFHSMLASGWIETSDSKALTLPVPGDTLELLLDFLYTDECQVVTESQNLELLYNVLVVADQMLITRLKEMCEVTLTSLVNDLYLFLVNLKNVAEMLEFSSIYNATQLKGACQQFILINLAALLEGRYLDAVSDDVMSDLTDYYQEKILAMSRRKITPYFDGPNKTFLEELACIVNQDENPHVENVSKKSRRKRRSRTKSVSDETDKSGNDSFQGNRRTSERQISISSDTSIISEEDLMEIDNMLATSPVEHVCFEDTPRKVPNLQKSSPVSIPLKAPVNQTQNAQKSWNSSESTHSQMSHWEQSPNQITSPKSPGISLRDIIAEERVQQDRQIANWGVSTPVAPKTKTLKQQPDDKSDSPEVRSEGKSMAEKTE
ncbi:hypothetical protein KUTeg_006939 [Tegillarca granosa]|uniref:BTB domain-containing protein n=1 Tax=Tegillarca granosa TaxID=220873 RepID=A0ABQ9FBT1_TEGGR|nr:hypothetical protein KUTeg_006939 [Tegillarca granosa]